MGMAAELESIIFGNPKGSRLITHEKNVELLAPPIPAIACIAPFSQSACEILVAPLIMCSIGSDVLLAFLMTSKLTPASRATSTQL
jgi:hypothetical protein